MFSDFLEIHTISLVFVGDFNPLIIQPFWLANKKLIRDQEATSAKIDLIHNELVRFSFDWAEIEVTKNRFVITTSKEPFFEPVRDLTRSIFEILKETPITALGINHFMHFSLPTADRYFQFGNKLAPLNNWDILKDPKLLQLEIFEKERIDGKNGHYKIKIQPSDLIPTNTVLISFNDHFTINSNSNSGGRNLEMVNELIQNWDSSLERAQKNSEKIWEKVNS